MRALAAMLTLLLALTFAPAAFAHATLIAADPADGAVLARAPPTLRLIFDEPVSPLALRLVGADHTQALTAFAVEGASVVVTLPPVGQGTHALSWRVVSADGHPVGGTVMFSVGAPSARPPVELAGDTRVRGALWLAKLALYVGLFAGVGGALFRAWTARVPVAGPLLVAALVSGLVASVASIGLQGLDALDLPLSALGKRTVWEAGLSTSYAATAIVSAFALFASLFSIAAQSIHQTRGLALLGLLGGALALPLSGHASAASPQWLTRPAVFVHAAGVAFWVGALVPLALRLRTGDHDPLIRFSRAIPAVLAAMLVAGLVLAIVQLDSVAALWTTAYGVVLSAKLAAVAALLILAAVNRRVLTARVAAGEDRARRLLVRSIVAEAALVLGVLGLVAAWRFTPPPRTLALAANAPALLHIHTGRLMADLKLEPGRMGVTQATVTIMRGDFTPFEPKEVALILTNREAGIEPIRRAAALREGVWVVERLTLPVSGGWHVRIDVLVSDFEKVVLEDVIAVGR